MIGLKNLIKSQTDCANHHQNVWAKNQNRFQAILERDFSSAVSCQILVNFGKQETRKT
jgi:hypothetical protein